MQYSFLLPSLLAITISAQHLRRQPHASSNFIGFENSSPDNTWVLRSTGDDIDYIVTRYNLALAPGEQEWVELSNNVPKNFIYQVCDTSGGAAILYINGPGLKCAVYSGAMINITLTVDAITVKPIENTAVNSLSVTGDASPYMISATTLPPPECDLPEPMQYNDGISRIINLEGATLPDPQFPYVCDLLYFAETGVNTVCLTFSWEYLQNFLGQDVPINWAAGGYGAQITQLINAWTEKGFHVILSMYDRMRYSYCSIGASDCWVSQERFASAWQQIALQFLNNSRITFDLMNNPDVYDIIEGDNNGTVIVLNNQNAAAKAIRSTGASQLILYSGNGGSNIATWNDTFYGASNAKTFVSKNISDNHYQLNVQMFYEEAESLPEEGCLASAENNPQSCVDKQNPENFIQFMQESGTQFIIRKTGGTNSSECIICINQGTMWAMMQEHITAIGMWVGGHAWMNFDGDVENPLYLAPIHNISQAQMTQGFQNVSNPITGEPFLIGISDKIPSAAPTPFPPNANSNTNYFSIALLCTYSASSIILLTGLYAAYLYHKKFFLSLSNNRHGIFAHQVPLLNDQEQEDHSSAIRVRSKPSK